MNTTTDCTTFADYSRTRYYLHCAHHAATLARVYRAI